LKPLFFILCIALCGTITGCGDRDPKTAGFNFYDAGYFKEALPRLEKAYANSQDDPELIVRLAHCLAEEKKDPRAALEILHASTLKFPDYARTYYQLGFIAFRHGSTENDENILQALGFTRKAAELDSTNFKIVDNVGMYHRRLDNLDSALFWFERAERINPEYPQLNQRLKDTKMLIARKAAADSILTADTLNINP